MPVSIADVIDGQAALAATAESRAETVDGEIVRLDNEIAETKNVLGNELKDKIDAVEDSFKTTVRSNATTYPGQRTLYCITFPWKETYTLRLFLCD